MKRYLIAGIAALALVGCEAETPEGPAGPGLSLPDAVADSTAAKAQIAWDLLSTKEQADICWGIQNFPDLTVSVLAESAARNNLSDAEAAAMATVVAEECGA